MKHKLGDNRSRRAGAIAETEDNGEVVIDLESLARGERDAFHRILADFIACAPKIEDLLKWAAKNPDRWMYTMRLLGQMAGFSDKVELNGNLLAQIGRLPDAELMRRLAEKEKQIEPPTVGGTAVPPGNANGAAKE